MREYQCHKKVFAAPIVSCDLVDNTVTYEAADGSRQVYMVDRGFFARGVPPTGSFLVEYDGGTYASWSPKHVFEDGYHTTGATLTSMTYDEAVIALTSGYQVAREIWKGAGKYLVEVVPDPKASPLGGFWTGNTKNVSWVGLKTKDTFGPWHPTVEERDAADWTIVAG